MPELAEVTSLANDMRRMVRGGTVVSVVYSPWYVSSRIAKRPAASLDAIVGSTITNIRRVGKAIVFEAKAPDAEFFVANRLGMTGTWRAGSKPDFPHMVLALELRLEDQTIFLVYTDVRKFGTFECRTSLAALESLRLYGPEITSTMFTLEWVVFVVSRHKLPIKVILLEQAYFSGIGNWLAAEILFTANIHPETIARSLSREQIVRLFQAIHVVVYGAINSGGASLKNWKHLNGDEGTAQYGMKVYGREGKPCLVCATPITRIVQRGRASFFCPECQSKDWKPREVPVGFVEEIQRTLEVPDDEERSSPAFDLR